MPVAAPQAMSLAQWRAYNRAEMTGVADAAAHLRMVN
jgi:hypothetical protein